MQFARINSYKKDPNTKDIILVAYPTDENGKPINITSEGGEEINIRLSEDGLQKLIREELPTEDKRIQEVLDKIHGIRIKCALNLEAIDGEIKTLSNSATTAFGQSGMNKNDILKTRALFLTKISLLTQKRHLSRLAIQEESELGLQLAKLRQASQSE